MAAKQTKSTNHTASHPETPSAPALRLWPADKIVRWAIDRIKPYPKNPFIHSDDQVEKIAASMMRFGVTAPMLVDEEGVLIYGHGRLRAASLLLSRGSGEFSSLPVVIARGWTDDEKRAYRIADNQLSYLSDFDMPMLKEELAVLNRNNFDMPLLGFSTDRVRQILANPKTRDPDAEAAPPPVVPVSQPGDLWLCGDHRLLCGDAGNHDDVARLFAGAGPHLLVSDPPYGVEYNPAWRSTLYRPRTNTGDPTEPGETFAALGKVSNDDQADWAGAWCISGCEVAYVWHSALKSAVSHQSLVQAGYDIRAQIIWNKAHFAFGRGDFHWKHEGCWYGVRKGGKSHWNGDRKQTTVWDIVSSVGFSTKKSGPDERTGHSTQKPVECMRRPIENNSKPGEGIYDPFLGSGTSMIAAELLARKCFGMEIDPAYVDVAVKRWQKISGRLATLEVTGAPVGASPSMAEVAISRGIEVTPEPEQEPDPEQTGALIIPSIRVDMGVEPLQ